MWESFIAIITKIFAFRFLAKMLLYLSLFFLLIIFILWQQGVIDEEMLDIMNFLKKNKGNSSYLEFILKYFK